MILLTLFFAAFFGTFGFGIIFNIEKRLLLPASLVGGVSMLIYHLVLNVTNHTLLAYFLAATTITLFSELLAKLLNTTVTSILVSALICLVPGGGAYYTMLSMVNSNLDDTFKHGTTTFLAATSLAFGIVFVTSLVKLLSDGRKGRYARRADKIKDVVAENKINQE